MPVFSLFPIPVYETSLDRPLTEKEITFVGNHEQKVNKNEGNFTSRDREILNRSEMSSLKEFILNQTRAYINTVIAPKEQLDPYISLSWLNYTYENGFHHKHSHSNSIISGVFYIQVLEDDKIVFYNQKYKALDITPKQYNIFNSESWWIPVQQNSLLLFPSDLVHGVEKNVHNKTRVSLAFNIFCRGDFGNRHGLNWLQLQ
jgi:uncharacterized protein (TIGR02466 family)